MREFTITIFLKSGGAVNYMADEVAVNHHMVGLSNILGSAKNGEPGVAWRVTTGTGNLVAVVPSDEIAAFVASENIDRAQREIVVIQLEIMKIQLQIAKKNLKRMDEGDDWKIPDSI